MEDTKYGQAKLSLIALRAAPAHNSEMVSQLLYNETYTILEEGEEWSKIQCLHDSYEGWVCNNQISYVSQEVFETPFQYYSSDLVHWHRSEGSYVYMGSPFYYTNSDAGFSKSELVCKSALEFVNTPYLWGGRSAAGIDCSGFMQIAFRMGGWLLPRDASLQAEIGKTIDWKDRQRGDLAFFKNKEGKITHVGLLIDGNSILHASAWVRIDTLTEAGIFYNNEQTHELAFIKRLP